MKNPISRKLIPNSIIRMINIIVVSVILTMFILNIDSVLEHAWMIQTKPIPEMYATIVNITDGCHSDICVIARVNRWVYRNVRVSPELGEMHMDFLYYGPEDVLKNGGVCRHLTVLEISMLKTAGIDYCRPRAMFRIDNGIYGHMWVECKINPFKYMECDPIEGVCWFEEYNRW